MTKPPLTALVLPATVDLAGDALVQSHLTELRDRVWALLAEVGREQLLTPDKDAEARLAAIAAQLGEACSALSWARDIATGRRGGRAVNAGLTPEAADEQASTEVGCAPRQLDAQPRPVPALVAQTVRDMPNVPRSAA